MLLQLIPTATGLPLQVFADNNNITLDANNTSLTLAGGNLVTTNPSGSYYYNYSRNVYLQTQHPKLGANLDGQQKEINPTLAISKSTIYGVDIRNIRGVAPYLTS